MSPEIVEPLWLTVLAAITATAVGTRSGGSELSPGRLVQVPPQVGLVLEFSNPLKLAGAGPPLRPFSRPHCALQKVTWSPIPAFRSPIPNAPPAGSGAGVRVGVLVGVGVLVAAGRVGVALAVAVSVAAGVGVVVAVSVAVGVAVSVVLAVGVAVAVAVSVGVPVGVAVGVA